MLAGIELGPELEEPPGPPLELPLKGKPDLLNIFISKEYRN